MATTTQSLPEDLSPHELRNAMRRTLNDALARFDSDEFQMELDVMSEEERNQAAVTRGEMYRTWRKLNNLQLDEIRDQLVENEAQLRTATKSLDDASKSLAKVAQFLDAACKFLAIACKLLPL